MRTAALELLSSERDFRFFKKKFLSKLVARVKDGNKKFFAANFPNFSFNTLTKRMTKRKMISGVLTYLAVVKFILFIVTGTDGVPLKRDAENNNDQNISFEDKSFNKYTRQLLTNYNNRNYFAAIYQNERTRDDFARFLNEGLTQQAKDDLAGLRIYRKVGDVEVPVIMFSPQMDSWLGILPQWKRTKRFMFKKIEEYLSLHPEVLNPTPTSNPVVVKP